MGGCASRPKESDMNNEETSVPNKTVSETIVAKENNIEESSEKQNQTETNEATFVEAKETFQAEPAKETAHVAAEPEVVVVAAVEEPSSSGEEAATTPEKVENVAVASENAEKTVEAVAVAEPEKVEVAAVEAVKVAETEPVKEESKKEEKEVVVTV
ncbi:unnamed protein product [Cochlearia groenlandica]